MKPENPFRLDNQATLITGGGTGIGFGIAHCMVKAGARVVLVGRRESELAKACAELGGGASFIAQDITRFDELPSLVQHAEQAAGSSISILVNNAGVHLKKFAADTTTEEFQTVFSTHVLAAHALTRALIPGMVSRGRGAVLFTSSMSAFFGIPQVMAYAAAKSAYYGMVLTLSAELSAKGVRVNAIAPGWIDSDMSRKSLENDPVRKTKAMSRTQMGRMGQPEEIGWAAVFLCSSAASYVTGVTLPVDGGAAIGF
jgi:NAD(P)-dependent dehydrogenase (short-subunit alcohol dehydrogenase family)